MRFICFFLLIHYVISAVKDPLLYLINKFEKKMDTNIYYVLNYERQKNEKHLCLAADGPYCSFLNGKYLGSDAVDNTETSKLKQNIKVNVKNTLEKLTLENKKTGQPQLFYYFDKLRENLDEIYSTQGQFSMNPEENSLTDYQDFEKTNTNVEVFLDFENLPIEKKDYTLDFAFKVYLGDVEELEKMPETTSSGSEYMLLNFKGFFVPSKEKVVTKKYPTKTEDLKEEFKDKLPNSVYIHSMDQEATVTFSKPVKILSLNVRKHDFLSYKNSVLEKDDKSKKIVFRIKGYLQSILVFDVEGLSPNPNFNSWVQLRLGDSNDPIDSLVFESNTDLDNLYLLIEDTGSSEITTEQMESIIGGIDELDTEYELDEPYIDPLTEDGPINNDNIENKPHIKTGNKADMESNGKNINNNEKISNNNEKISNNNEKISNNNEKISNNLKDREKVGKHIKSTFADNLLEELKNMVEILENDEFALFEKFQKIKPKDMETLRNNMQKFMKEFPELEGLLRNDGTTLDEKDAAELFNRIEVKFPGFKRNFHALMNAGENSSKNKKEKEKKK